MLCESLYCTAFVVVLSSMVRLSYNAYFPVQKYRRDLTGFY